jgi:hypothetical protein
MTFPFKIPFATSGNQAAIPETDLSGFVNFTDGYTPDYQLDPETDPNGKVLERDKWNWLFNRITAALGEGQRNGAFEWYSALAPYGLGAVVVRDGRRWQSTVSNNSTEPGDVGATWSDITNSPSEFAKTLLDDATANDAQTTLGVQENTQADAEAMTIGTGRITPRRLLQALRASTAQATQSLRGVMRLADQTEVDGGVVATVAVTPATLYAASFGRGVQSVQNVQASRAIGTTYTNSTNKAIVVSVAISLTAGAVSDGLVNGEIFSRASNNGTGGATITHLLFVPPGSTYRVDVGSISSWKEYR